MRYINNFQEALKKLDDFLNTSKNCDFKHPFENHTVLEWLRMVFEESNSPLKIVKEGHLWLI
jgi:hypothetical protein